jgi:hypothetical protein
MGRRKETELQGKEVMLEESSDRDREGTKAFDKQIY